MSTTPLLEVRQATKRYPGVLALNKVNMTLNRGEVVAVIGENGAGKSTLMKILAGVEKQDSGEILVEGKPTAIEVAEIRWTRPAEAGDLALPPLDQAVLRTILSDW